MKKITKFFALAIVIFAFAASAFGQVSATASATATIVSPIAISKTADMNFGNVAVNASLGTVVLTPAGTRSVTGGCTLPVVTGTVAAAAFTVTGQANFTYSITLPGAATTITDGAGHSMTVTPWASTPTPTGTLSAGGSQALTVGATLNVSASQTAGVYSSSNAGGSGDFTVQVNYN